MIYKLTTATKAIIPVHLFGQCAQMDDIRQIVTAARGIPIIEDACQSIGAEYNGVPAGGLGDVACFSFYRFDVPIGILLTKPNNCLRIWLMLHSIAYT